MNEEYRENSSQTESLTSRIEELIKSGRRRQSSAGQSKNGPVLEAAYSEASLFKKWHYRVKQTLQEGGVSDRADLTTSSIPSYNPLTDNHTDQEKRQIIRDVVNEYEIKIKSLEALRDSITYQASKSIGDKEVIVFDPEKGIYHNNDPGLAYNIRYGGSRYHMVDLVMSTEERVGIEELKEVRNKSDVSNQVIIQEINKINKSFKGNLNVDYNLIKSLENKEYTVNSDKIHIRYKD